MFVFEWAGGMVLFLIMAVLAIYFYGKNQRDIGYELGRDDRYTELAAERRTGRHRMTQPRTTPPAPPPRPARPRTPWYTRTGNPKPGRVQLPRGGAIGTFLDRKPAAGIDTVLLDPQPAPGLNGADDTGTMPRVDLASTGEFRAIAKARTSAWIAEHCPGAEEAEAIA